MCGSCSWAMVDMTIECGVFSIAELGLPSSKHTKSYGKRTIYGWFTLLKWCFSIVMLNYQRVLTSVNDAALLFWDGRSVLEWPILFQQKRRIVNKIVTDGDAKICQDMPSVSWSLIHQLGTVCCVLYDASVLHPSYQESRDLMVLMLDECPSALLRVRVWILYWLHKKRKFKNRASRAFN